MITELTDENFETLVHHNNRPVCVMFHADWAGPCHLSYQMFEEAATRNTEFYFGKLDIDAHPYVPKDYNLRSVPTFMVFDGARLERLLTGAVTGEELDEFLKEEST